MSTKEGSFWENIGCAAMIFALLAGVALVIMAGRIHLVH